MARGEDVLTSEVQAGLASEIQIRERDERPALTPRAHEILVLTANGHSAPDIGKQRHLSQSTVKTHLKSLYEKLGVSEPCRRRGRVDARRPARVARVQARF